MAEEEVTFYSEGCEVAAVITIPSEEQPVPGVVLCHGFGGLKEQILPGHAAELGSAGYAVLRFDYRGFGESEGLSKFAHPPVQADDIRNAITYLASRDEVDAERLGVYGRAATGGGLASFVAGRDDRVSAMVSSMAFSDGKQWLRDLRREYEWLALKDRVAENATQRVVDGASSKIAAVGGSESVLIAPPERRDSGFSDNDEPETEPDDGIPLRAIEGLIEFRPLDVVDDTTSCATQWICISNDSVTPAYHSEAMYERAPEPKELVELEGTHYEIVDRLKDDEIRHMINWFDRHL